MKNLKKAITLVLALIIALSTCMVGVSASATEDEVNTTPTEKPTGDYFISDTEGADRESAKTYAYGYIGDVDLTDSVNIKDATAIQKHAASLLDLRDTNAILADADLSDSINVKDATSIQKWVAGIEVNAPVYRLLTATDETIEHVHAYTFKNTSATCREGGYVLYTCACGETYKSNETTSLGHDWGEWIVIKEPAIGVEGIEEKVCKRCNEDRTRAIDMLIEGDPEVIKAARDVLPLLQYNTRCFDSVYDISDSNIRKLAYNSLLRESKYEVVGEDNLFAFERSGLEAALSIYLDTVFDWKSLNNTDVYRVEYYDEATDKVIARVGTGLGLFVELRVSGFTDNGNGTYSIGIDSKDVTSDVWETNTHELVLKKTEYGYPAVSYAEKDTEDEIVPPEDYTREAFSFAGKLLLALNYSAIREFDSVDEAFENLYKISRVAYFQAYFDNKYTVNEEGFYTFNREDLEDILLEYFGRTIDWTALDDKYSNGQYNESNDTLSIRDIFYVKPAQSWGPITVSTIIGENVYTVEVSIVDNENEDETSSATLTLNKTEDGFAAINLIHNHNWKEWEVTKPATVFAEGEEIRQCKHCYKTEIQSIDKLPSELTEEEMAELNDVMSSAEEMLPGFMLSVRFFDSVDDALSRNQARNLAYMSVDGTVNEETNLCTYNRIDLDNALLGYFGKTIDWTILNNKGEDSIYKTEYYDKETDTVIIYAFGGRGVFEKWTPTNVTKTDKDTYTVDVEIFDADTYETTYAELIIVKTEYGYNAQSLKEK